MSPIFRSDISLLPVYCDRCICVPWIYYLNVNFYFSILISVVLVASFIALVAIVYLKVYRQKNGEYNMFTDV